MRGTTRIILIPSLIAHAGTAGLVAGVARPAVTALLVVAMAFINPALLPPLFEVGELSFRVADVFFFLLLGVFLGVAALRPLQVAPQLKRLLLPLAPFFIWAGISLLWVALRTPAVLAMSATSYLRLMQTMLLGVLVHLAFRREADVRMFQKGFVVFSLISVAIAFGQMLVAVAQTGQLALAFRYTSVLGEHTLGLVAGLSFVLGLISRDHGKSRGLWSALLLTGFLGLFLSKSASAIFATAGSTAIFFALRERLNVVTVSKVVLVAVVLIGAAALAVSRWRSDDIVGFLVLTGGSYAQRLMIYYAGAQIFLANPIMGVGWMTTGTPAYIGSPDLNAMLMARFPLLPEWYFFLDEPQSLHNMYLQFLAELGLVGLALFVFAVIVIGRRVTDMIRSLPAGSPKRMWAGFYALSFVFLLFWWNTGPLFGGQTESVLLFVLLGVFASTVASADSGTESRPS